MCLLDNPHDKGALHMPDVFHLSQLVDMEVIVRVHVLHRHLEQEVELPGDDVTFHDFRHLLNGLDKPGPGFLVVLLEGYIANGQQSLLYFGMIQQGRILPDDASVLQPPYPLVNGCRAQMDLRRNFTNGDLGIILQ